MGTFLALLTGLAGPVAQATASIADLIKSKNEAKTNIELTSINANLQEMQEKKAALVALAANRLGATFTATVQLLLALGPASYILKYYFWDKVVGSFYGCAGTNPMRPLMDCATFQTDGLSIQMAAAMTAVLGFYLLWTKRD